MEFFDIQKAIDEPKLNNLINNFVDIITYLVIDFEKRFYKTVTSLYNDISMYDFILCTTNKSIVSMILTSHETYFNKLFFDIQNETENITQNSDIISKIKELSIDLENPWQMILEKLLDASYNLHLDIERAELPADSIEEYIENVKEQLSIQVQKKDFVSFLSPLTIKQSIEYDIVSVNTKVYNIQISKFNDGF